MGGGIPPKQGAQFLLIWSHILQYWLYLNVHLVVEFFTAIGNISALMMIFYFLLRERLANYQIL